MVDSFVKKWAAENATQRVRGVQTVAKGSSQMVVVDESAVAEQGTAEFGEALEMLGFAFVAADESPVVLQPGQAGFDDPAVPAEPLRGLHPLAGDPDLDTPVA